VSLKNNDDTAAVYNIITSHHPHPLITCPNPTANVNGCCPGSFVDQNFSARLLFFPYPVQCTVTSCPRRGRTPLPARRIVLVKPMFSCLLDKRYLVVVSMIITFDLHYIWAGSGQRAAAVIATKRFLDLSLLSLESLTFALLCTPRMF
jgi:hypothetical protein